MAPKLWDNLLQVTNAYLTIPRDSCSGDDLDLYSGGIWFEAWVRIRAVISSFYVSAKKCWDIGLK